MVGRREKSYKTQKAVRNPSGSHNQIQRLASHNEGLESLRGGRRPQEAGLVSVHRSKVAQDATTPPTISQDSIKRVGSSIRQRFRLRLRLQLFSAPKHLQKLHSITLAIYHIQKLCKTAGDRENDLQAVVAVVAVIPSDLGEISLLGVFKTQLNGCFKRQLCSRE